MSGSAATIAAKACGYHDGLAWARPGPTSAPTAPAAAALNNVRRLIRQDASPGPAERDGIDSSMPREGDISCRRL
jgi:hypothetical protein